MTLVERLEKLHQRLKRKVQFQLEDKRYDTAAAEERDLIGDTLKRLAELEVKPNA